MATNTDLKAGLKSHVIDTKNQIEHLDKVFAKLGKQPKGTDCPAMDGLIKEGDETAGEIDDKAVLNAAIVANSQAVEHYEMSATERSSRGPKSLATTMLFVCLPRT
jgi:ferritin-like metal-binding protein YciE